MHGVDSVDGQLTHLNNGIVFRIANTKSNFEKIELHFQVVPAGRFYEIARNKGVGLTFASMGMTSFCDGPADGTNLTGVGEIRLMPDMSTLFRLPW